MFEFLAYALYTAKKIEISKPNVGITTMKFNSRIDFAILISIIAVFLFANGQVYLAGLLSVFNIDPIVLNFSIQDKIYIGYLKGFKFLLYSILVFIIYIVVRYIVNSLDILKNIGKYLSNKFEKFRSQTHQPRIHNSLRDEELDNVYDQHTWLSIVLLIFLISTIFMLAHTEKKAKANAKQALQDFDFSATVQLKNNDSDIVPELFLIKCGSNLCALIDRDKNVTLEDPKNIIFPVKVDQVKK